MYPLSQACSRLSSPMMGRYNGPRYRLWSTCPNSCRTISCCCVPTMIYSPRVIPPGNESRKKNLMFPSLCFVSPFKNSRKSSPTRFCGSCHIHKAKAFISCIFYRQSSSLQTKILRPIVLEEQTSR